LFLETIVRGENSRRIGIHHLEVLSVDDAQDTMAGGLCLGCDDGQTFANEGIHKGGLANIGVAHNVDKSGFMIT
jgi:hypothetical protein